MDKELAKTLLKMRPGETVMVDGKVYRRSSEQNFKFSSGKVGIDVVRKDAFGWSDGIDELFSPDRMYRVILRKPCQFTYLVCLERHGKKLAEFGPYEGELGSPCWVAYIVMHAVVDTAKIINQHRFNGPSAE